MEVRHLYHSREKEEKKVEMEHCSQPAKMSKQTYNSIKKEKKKQLKQLLLIKYLTARSAPVLLRTCKLTQQKTIEVWWHLQIRGGKESFHK